MSIINGMGGSDFIRIISSWTCRCGYCCMYCIFMALAFLVDRTVFWLSVNWIDRRRTLLQQNKIWMPISKINRQILPREPITSQSESPIFHHPPPIWAFVQQYNLIQEKYHRDFIRNADNLPTQVKHKVTQCLAET